MVPKIVLVFQTYLLFFKNEHPSYLFDTIPKVLSARTTKNHNNILLFNVKHEYFFFSIHCYWVEQVHTMHLLSIILMKLNYLQDYALG